MAFQQHWNNRPRKHRPISSTLSHNLSYLRDISVHGQTGVFCDAYKAVKIEEFLITALKTRCMRRLNVKRLNCSLHGKEIEILWPFVGFVSALSCVLEHCESHAQERSLFPRCVGTGLMLQQWSDVQKGLIPEGIFTGSEMDSINSSPLWNVICWQQQLILDLESSNTNSQAQTHFGRFCFVVVILNVKC